MLCWTLASEAFDRSRTNSEYVLATEAMLKLGCGLAGVSNTPLRGLPFSCASFSLLQPCRRGLGRLPTPGVRANGVLFAERGGRGPGERHTAPYTERLLLFEVTLEMLDVALNFRVLMGVVVPRSLRLVGVRTAVPYSMSSSVCLLFFRCLSCFSFSFSIRCSSHCSSTYCRNFCPCTKNSRSCSLSHVSIWAFAAQTSVSPLSEDSLLC